MQGAARTGAQFSQLNEHRKHSSNTADGASRPFSKPYRLESIVVKGSRRLSAQTLSKTLGLQYGQALDDQLVMDTRARLLGLGVFESVLLYLKKGSQKGWARLVIEVEDDPNVLTEWAWGATLAVTQSERQATKGSPEASPIGYSLELISRNFLRSLHRMALLVDADSQGTMRHGIFSYGLPKYAAEDTRFDAKLELIDTERRFHDTLGFGRRVQGLWTKHRHHRSHLRYGVAMYANQDDRYSMPGYPQTVGGPKISYFEETRLLAFIPGAGYKFETGVILAPLEPKSSVVEVEGAKTWPGKLFATTASFRSLTVLTGSYGLRSELRLDLPFGMAFGVREQAQLYGMARGGFDTTDLGRFQGSAALFGIRYHSSGFIAEFAIQITSSPQQLRKIRRLPHSSAQRGVGYE